jgi:purine catabolism regulator
VRAEYGDLAVLDLVDVGSPRALEFARRVLGSLVDPGASAMQLETLRMLCRHGFSQKLAAAALGIHPHTLAYRVAQIRQRHGIDLEDADTRLRVHLAVLIVAP